MINKKAVAILGAILLLIIGTVGFLIYQRSQNTDTTEITPPPPAVIVDDTPPPPVDTPPSEVPPTETPPPAPVVTSAKLTESGVLGPVLFYQGNGIAYLNSQGQLFQADLQESSGQVGLANLQELVIPQRSSINRVLWPDAGNNFMVERTDSGQVRFSVYLSEKGEYVDLPPQVVSAVWLPGGQQILYVWTETDGKSTLNISNADNTNWITITDFWEPDNAITVSPDGRSVAFYQTKNQTEPNKLNLVTIDGKVFKSAVPAGVNKGALWSPDSRNILFLKREGAASNLWMVNLMNGETKNLNIILDSLDKVVWSQDSKTIYAGGSLDGAGEQLHKIDVASGAIQSFEVGNGDVREPFLNSTASVLFFRNAADNNRLYYINLSNLSQ